MDENQLKELTETLMQYNGIPENLLNENSNLSACSAIQTSKQFEEHIKSLRIKFKKQEE